MRASVLLETLRIVFRLAQNRTSHTSLGVEMDLKRAMPLYRPGRRHHPFKFHAIPIHAKGLARSGSSPDFQRF